MTLSPCGLVDSSSAPQLASSWQFQFLTWRQCVRAMSLNCCAAWQRSSPWSRASPLSSMAAAPTWTLWPTVLKRPRSGCRDFGCWWTLSPAWTNRSSWTSIGPKESEWGPGVTEGATCCRDRDRWEEVQSEGCPRIQCGGHGRLRLMRG